jgi:hypothetical protein
MSDLSWTTSWDSVLFYEDQLLPNNYTMTIHFDISTDNAEEQNIAFDRIKYFIDKVLQDAIFTCMDDEHNAYFQSNFKQKLVTFPLPPQDLVVVSAIYAKMNSILEGRLHITQMSLSSIQGDNVTIHFDEDFAEESTALTSHELIKAAEKTPWWFRNDCGSADFFTKDEDTETLTFVTDVTDWTNTGLEWPPSETKIKKDASNWNPTIIPGGKTRH